MNFFYFRLHGINDCRHFRILCNAGHCAGRESFCCHHPLQDPSASPFTCQPHDLSFSSCRLNGCVYYDPSRGKLHWNISLKTFNAWWIVRKYPKRNFIPQKGHVFLINFIGTFESNLIFCDALSSSIRPSSFHFLPIQKTVSFFRIRRFEILSSMPTRHILQQSAGNAIFILIVYRYLERI